MIRSLILQKFPLYLVIKPKLCFYYIIFIIFMHDLLRKYLIACNAFLVDC